MRKSRTEVGREEEKDGRREGGRKRWTLFSIPSGPSPEFLHRWAGGSVMLFEGEKGESGTILNLMFHRHCKSWGPFWSRY
jgi:hypothetical protein